MQKKILFIGHDANFAGAQIVLLHFLKFLKDKEKIKTLLVLGTGGALQSQFEEATKTLFWNNKKEIKKGKVAKIQSLFSKENLDGNNEIKKEIEAFDPDIIFINTIANGQIISELDYLKKPIILYCHELEKSLQTYSNQKDLEFQLATAKHIFCASPPIVENFNKKYKIAEEKLSLLLPFIDGQVLEKKLENTDKKTIKEELKIPANAIVIGGCGLLEWRKGVDIFINTALNLLQKTQKEVHFIWVGVHKTSHEYYNLLFDLDRMGIAEKVHLVEASNDIVKYQACFDIFFLSSREDPFPLVMFETGMNKIPMVCFEKSGGAAKYSNENELIAPYLDIQKAGDILLNLAENEQKRKELGAIFYQKAKEHDIALCGDEVLENILELGKNN